MAVYQIKRTQQIDAAPDRVWEFFSDPRNLAKITPPYIDFKIIGDLPPGPVVEGQLIEYTLSPILHIGIRWITEITHVDKYKKFVDEQKKGPYKLWRHQHFFEQNDSGVKMTDIVNYELPMSIIGNMAHALFIKRQLNGIFDYRHQQVEKIFGSQSLIHEQV